MTIATTTGTAPVAAGILERTQGLVTPAEVLWVGSIVMLIVLMVSVLVFATTSAGAGRSGLERIQGLRDGTLSPDEAVAWRNAETELIREKRRRVIAPMAVVIVFLVVMIGVMYLVATDVSPTTDVSGTLTPSIFV